MCLGIAIARAPAKSQQLIVDLISDSCITQNMSQMSPIESCFLPTIAFLGMLEVVKLHEAYDVKDMHISYENSVRFSFCCFIDVIPEKGGLLMFRKVSIEIIYTKAPGKQGWQNYCFRMKTLPYTGMCPESELLGMIISIDQNIHPCDEFWSNSFVSTRDKNINQTSLLIIVRKPHIRAGLSQRFII